MRKPTLSPSKLTTYLVCPTKYMFTYVDARGKWYLRARSHYSFGSTLHKVLQRFHDSGETGVASVEEAVAAVEENWIDSGYQSPSAMMEALGEGKALIEAYTSAVLETPSEATTIALEKRFRLDMGDFVLNGIVDRLDEYPDGSLEIVDYKSGRGSVSAQQVESDIAMACYRLLVGEAYPGRKISASIIALRVNEKANHWWPDDECEQFKQDLGVLGTEILNRDYENHRPTRKAACETCDFKPLCIKYEDFEGTGSTDPEPQAPLF